jgi:hypothetical protein
MYRPVVKPYSDDNYSLVFRALMIITILLTWIYLFGIPYTTIPHMLNVFTLIKERI